MSKDGRDIRLTTTEQRLLLEGLWDCESDVRMLAAEQVDLTDRSRRRLHYLSTDPLETAEVRAAARARLTRA